MALVFVQFIFVLTLLIKMCFALVPKLVPRTVDFHWYWYRTLKFWYRDNPSMLCVYSRSIWEASAVIDMPQVINQPAACHHSPLSEETGLEVCPQCVDVNLCSVF